MKIKYSKLIIFTLSLIILDELPIGFTEQEWENRHLIETMGGKLILQLVPLGILRNMNQCRVYL